MGVVVQTAEGQLPGCNLQTLQTVQTSILNLTLET